MIKIGKNIKKYRKKRGLTQEALAQLVGVSAQAVSKWECEDSIPDGTLYIPIADALSLSLDRLCGYDKVYETDTYAALNKIIGNTQRESKFEKVREICWQAEKALFVGYMDIDCEYNKDELDWLHDSSSVSDDTGFTFVSNRQDLPFFSVFPKPKKGFRNALKYDEKYREFFEALGNKYVLKAFFYLYSQEQNYTFEKEVLATACEIPDVEIDDVIEKLSCFCFWKGGNECEINNEKRLLYMVRQRYEMVALFAVANELLFHANLFSYQSMQMNKPWL